MRWNYETNPWRRRFAIIPVCADGECIWLEWYWSRWYGDCTLVRFCKEKPND